MDWEFVGYSDTAYDAAELVEHLSAHGIDDQVWISLLPELGIQDDTTRRRFLAAQRSVALRWLSVCGSVVTNGPTSSNTRPSESTDS